MKKQAYSTQTTFDISDEEKQIASQAINIFNEVIGLLQKSLDHLDIIYDPFYKYQNLQSNEVIEYRVALRRYRDKIRENFQEVLGKTHKAVVLMGEFSSDTKTRELLTSFMEEMDDIKDQVNYLLQVFSDIGSVNFRNGILNGIDNVRKQSAQAKQLLNERILPHIETNILAKNWIGNIVDENDNRVYQRSPLVVRLFKERNEALNNLGE